MGAAHLSEQPLDLTATAQGRGAQDSQQVLEGWGKGRIAQHVAVADHGRRPAGPGHPAAQQPGASGAAAECAAVSPSHTMQRDVITGPVRIGRNSHQPLKTGLGDQQTIKGIGVQQRQLTSLNHMPILNHQD